MGLVDTIQQDLILALKSKDQASVSALRSAKSAFQLEQIAQGSLSDERAFALVKKQIKQREDSLNTYQQAGRDDLAAVEQAEINVLKKYLPEEMSEDELRRVITEIVSVAEDKSFGPLMGKVMSAVHGKADGKIAQDLLKQVLADHA